MADKIAVENVNTPGRTSTVDAGKYTAMCDAMLAVIPQAEPGLTATEIKERAKPLLPEALFPGGATSGWWVKCVQLDLEAKGRLKRHQTRPLTFTQS